MQRPFFPHKSTQLTQVCEPSASIKSSWKDLEIQNKSNVSLGVFVGVRMHRMFWAVDVNQQQQQKALEAAGKLESVMQENERIKLGHAHWAE